MSQHQVIICLATWSILQNLPQSLSKAPCQCQRKDSWDLAQGWAKKKDTHISDKQWETVQRMVPLAKALVSDETHPRPGIGVAERKDLL